MTLTGVWPLGERPAQECLALAARLEQGSEHPVARSLRAAAPAAGGEVLELRNEPGSGIEGVVDGVSCRLGTPQFVSVVARNPMPEALARKVESGETVVALGSAEGGWIAALSFEDELRPDAAQTVRELRRQGRRVHLLSGDVPEAARRVARRAGIETVVAGVSPAEKLEYVIALQERGAVVAMVGDGVNDAPVLARAQVSIAMGEGTQVAQASADMVLLSGRLSALVEGMQVSARTWSVIRENLLWASAYNLVALPLAVTGYVTPWIAGIGMAASSLLVVLNALRLTVPERGSRSSDRAAASAPSGDRDFGTRSSILDPRP